MKQYLTNVTAATNQFRHRDVTHPDFDNELKNWFFSHQDKMIISDAIIKEKAKDLASKYKDMDLNEFRFSNGWLSKFKKRNGICLKTMHGESGSVDETVISTLLPELIDEKKYGDPKDV